MSRDNLNADFHLLRQQHLLAKEPALVGECAGKFNLVEVPEDFLRQLLPGTLTLAAQNFTKPGKHPLLLMFNDTHLRNGTFPIPMNLHYNEFVVMVPFVSFCRQDAGANNLYCFLPVLYLDDMRAVMGGRIFWDFNKQMADFKVNNTSFEVSRSQPLFSTTFVLSNEDLPTHSVTNFRAIEPILTLPVIEDGLFGFMSCRYNIDFQNAKLTPIQSVTKNFNCKYLPQQAVLDVPSILESKMGGFFMQYHWSLTYLKHIDTKL